MTIICLKKMKKELMYQSERYQELRKQRGMTLLEIIIVLGIIGTISAGVVILAQRAFDSKAVADLVTNTNTVRTAIKETYGPQGTFPQALAGEAAGLTDSTITTSTPLTPMGRLVALGRLSPSELKNPISGNYFNIGGATINAGVNRGYIIMVNGLNQKQCRNILVQLANQWEYVEVVGNMPSGRYSDIIVNLTAATRGVTDIPADIAAGVPASVELAPVGIFRTMAVNGNNTLTPDSIITACEDSSTNGIILGSR